MGGTEQHHEARTLDASHFVIGHRDMCAIYPLDDCSHGDHVTAADLPQSRAWEQPRWEKTLCSLR
jgi:hypothetical protein